MIQSSYAEERIEKIINNNSIFAIALKEVIPKTNEIKEPKREYNELKNAPVRTLDFYVSKKNNIDEILGRTAAQIAIEIGANCVVSFKKINSEVQNEDRIPIKVSVFKKDFDFKKIEYETKVKKEVLGSINQTKEILIEAVNKKFIKNGDRVVCVQDQSLGTGFHGLIFVFDVDKLFFNISSYRLTENIDPEVIKSVINLALEIGKEGREGKHIGTAFIIGPQEEILKYSKQMILNPFNGYPESMRKIIDEDLKETIKNFAQLDGVFIINNDGTIVSAGTYIEANTNIEEVKNLKGFGTRHLCSAAITKLTKSIAVVVSESGGVVRVFKNGKIILTLS
ncbi:MAG: DNA integrity scanning protein DisA nucleotide-binding domain protein [Candidatus Woesearchaeota archaeon]